jgi:hypothetical protein
VYTLPLLIDVVCVCGRNGFRDEAENADFKHEISIGATEPDKTLSCDCGKRYRLHPQTGHIHILSL